MLVVQCSSFAQVWLKNTTTHPVAYCAYNTTTHPVAYCACNTTHPVAYCACNTTTHLTVQFAYIRNYFLPIAGSAQKMRRKKNKEKVKYVFQFILSIYTIFSSLIRRTKKGLQTKEIYCNLSYLSLLNFSDSGQQYGSGTLSQLVTIDNIRSLKSTF